MAEVYRFFPDSGGDRLYVADDFDDTFHQLFKRAEGVLQLDNQLAVSATGGLSVNIATGVAVKAGYLYKNTAVQNLALNPVTNGSKRIDRIVIHRDTSARTFKATVIQGTEGASPSPPAIDGTNDVLLAKILIDNTSGYTYTVTDERTYRIFDADTVSGYGPATANKIWVGGINDGNGGQPPAPKTYGQSTSNVPTGTPTTLFDLGASASAYLIIAQNATDYTWTYAITYYQGRTYVINQIYSSGGGMALSLSGSVVKITHTAGANRTIEWYATRLGW